MSNQTTRRKRRSRVKKSKAPLFFGLGLAAAVVGIIVLVIVLNNANTNTIGDGDIAIDPLDPSIPVGQTEDGYWYKGNPDAPIKVVEFADYECPACRQMETALKEGQLEEKYLQTGLVQFIYREFPLSSIHPAAHVSAEIARCSGDQDPNLFWPVHDALFQTQSQWDGGANDARNILLNAAEVAGANRSELEACLDAGTHAEFVREATETAPSEGATGTPTFFVNGQTVSSSSLFTVLENLAKTEQNS